MTPTSPARVYMTLLICYALLLSPAVTIAQRNAFHFSTPPVFQTSSVHAWVYRIPTDSVYKIVYQGAAIQPNATWMQQKPWIIAPDRLDSLMSATPPRAGYYMSVKAEGNRISLAFGHKKGFRVNIMRMEQITLLSVVDSNDVAIRDASVIRKHKTILFDPLMKGYVLDDFSNGDLVTIRHGDDIQFLDCSVKENSNYERPKPRNETYDHNRELRFYNGYLLTNMPKYRPGDTVKWKAYLLDPQSDNRPVKEPLRVSFATEEYRAKVFMVSPAYPAAEPGVYFGEFVLGDSVKTDKQYALHIYGTRTAFRLNTRFELEDYLLDETNLKVTTDGAPLYQPGDSVNIYAYAFNSNNLPLLDGKITVSVLPGNYRSPSGKRYFIPDTLYTATVPVSADGETSLGFSTNHFPEILHDFRVMIRLENSNLESRDTMLVLRYSNDPGYIRVKQSGNKLLAELIRNKKSVPGKGSRIVQHTSRAGREEQIVFPYEYTIGDNDVNVLFRLPDSSRKIAGSLYHSVEDAYLDGVSDFMGDTAVLQIINPYHVSFRYSVYIGNKYHSYGVIQGDTVIRLYSKKGKTVTVIGAYVWKGTSRSKRFEVFKMDKQLNIDLAKKDIIYPGQTDSISIFLSNKDGKGIGKTNVTVLAFNSQFKEDHTTDVPYGGLLYPAYTAKKIRNVSERPMLYLNARMADRAWLARCGADTQFFYKHLYLLPDDITWMTYDIPTSVMPQVGFYLYRQGHYYQPEIIYVDGRPVYVKRASSTNPSGIFISEGPHTIRFRMAREEYHIEQFYACKGIKTDIYLNIDSVGPLYRNDTVGDTVKMYRRDHLRSLVSKVRMPDTLKTHEQYALAGSLMMYRNEYSQIPVMQQYPYQFDGWNINSKGMHYLPGGNGHVMLVGPFNFYDSIGFFQPSNTKLKFIPERGYIFSFRPQMTRVERQGTDQLLSYRLTDDIISLPQSYVAANPDSFDSLVVNPTAEQPLIQTYKSAVLAGNRIRYGFKTGELTSAPDAATAGVSIVPLEDSVIRYVICRKKGRKDSVMILPQCFNCGLRTAPGNYEITVIWKDDRYAVYDSVQLRNGGITLVPVSYCTTIGKFNFHKIPKWLAGNMVSDTLADASWNLYTISEQAYRSYPVQGGYYSGSGASGIAGTLTDEKGEPLPSARVTAAQGGITRGGTITNFDGEFIIKPLEPGRYDIIFRWQNFQQTVTGVILNSEQLSVVNNKLNTTQDLGGRKSEIIIRAARRSVPPLVDFRSPSASSTKTAEYIERAPTTNMADVASLSTQSYQSRDGGSISLSGGRNTTTQYVIDGMIVSGNTNPVMGSVDQATTYVGGMPARYGEGTGGLIDASYNGDVTGTSKKSYYLSSEKSKNFIGEFMANMMGASGMRKHFRDWAIWEPNLWTDESGRTSFKVTYPDNMTSWKTYVLAMNRDRFAGRIVRLTRSFKPLSAQLSAPRFLRYGDTVEVIGKVTNYTQQPFRLQYNFLAGDSLSMRDTMLVHNTRVAAYRAAAPAHNRADTTDFTLTFSIRAENGYADGEEHTIPVMPVGVMESKGQFSPMISDTMIVSRPDSSAGYFTGKAKVYVDGSMLEVMLREIEMLKEYPHGCNEQLTTKLLAIYYEETIKKLLGNTNFNNTVTKRKILDQLVRAQRNDGGFGWWSNNNADYRITNYIISTMQKINEDGWLDFIIRRGLSYLNSRMDDMSVSDRIATLGTLSTGKYPANFKPLLDKINVAEMSVYNRLAMVKIRKEQGMSYRSELDTLMKLKHESKRGISWGNITYYDWYRDDLATTLLAYAVVKDDSVYSKLIPGITSGLMFERQNGYYRNTASSGLVLTTLLPELLKQRAFADHKQPTFVRVSGALKDSITTFPKTYDLAHHNPELKFEKKGINPVFVSVVYSYFNIKPQRRDSDFVVNTYFLDNRYDTVTYLKAGEKITVRTTVRCKKDAEYVMIEVPVPAGCIQADKKNGYHPYPEVAREHFKDQTYIFCNKLVKGIYSFDVVLEARYKGAYNLSPARAGMMYYPEEYGNTEVKKIKIQ